MGRPTTESIMSALYSALIASVQTTFTANTAVNSVALLSPSSTAGLFVGLPVFGASVPRGAIITNLSPLTLSLAPTANGRQVTLTTGFLTTGRRLQFWNQVAAQPALFLRSISEDSEYRDTIQQMLTINAEIWIYSNAGENPDVVPETALNNLLEAVKNVFLPDSSMGTYTIGGLVSWCRIDGKIEKEPGDASGQAIAAVPVTITVP